MSFSFIQSFCVPIILLKVPIMKKEIWNQTGNQSKTTFLEVINGPIIYKVYKDLCTKILLITERRLTRWQFSATDPSSIFFNTGTIYENFQHIWKTRFLEELTGSSGPQLFRTTTKISGADALEESSSVMIFSIILHHTILS